LQAQQGKVARLLGAKPHQGLCMEPEPAAVAEHHLPRRRQTATLGTDAASFLKPIGHAASIPEATLPSETKPGQGFLDHGESYTYGWGSDQHCLNNPMTLLQAYLSNPRTRRALSKKPGQAGFSLIELVVVIAVLAVLTAIALPNFLGVSDDASARSAQQAVITAFKECQVKKARGEVTATAAFVPVSLTDFTVYSMASNTTLASQSTAPGSPTYLCFSGSPLAMNRFFALPKETAKFPRFGVTSDGDKECNSGDTGKSKTFNVGCTGAGASGAFDTATTNEWR
jgi:prepilin-type N-terminal cleavage/methylation domain-containing protein